MTQNPPAPGHAASSISAINHIALMTGDLDRLADFYETVFGAQILARSQGSPRKCFIRLTPATSLHVFEVAPERARRPEDDRFDPGSINHFALEARDPETFISTRARLIQAGRAEEPVYEAPGRYTIFASDPDGLFIELTLPKTSDWSPPFATEPFVGLGQPAVPVPEH
jgi:catechol 2,3-dioxygenase-like lactoylglutathione lyase family enzyme